MGKTEEYIDLFKQSMYIDKNLSNNSINAYIIDINQFKSFLDKSKIKSTLIDISKDDISYYIHYIKTVKYFSSSTCARKVSAIRMFYRCLFSNGIISKNIASDISVPKVGSAIPKVLDVIEITSLLDTAKIHNPMLYAFLECLYSCGARVSELASLKRGDIVDNGDFLLIYGKGSKERLVPLNNIAKDILLDWMSSHKSKWAFPSPRSIQIHISRERIYVMLKDIALKANVNPKKVSPHIFRHSFASHMINNGSDLKVVQDILGHSSLSTTQRYMHTPNKRIFNLVSNSQLANYLKKNS